MAYVAITDTLMGDVQRILRNMRSAEASALPPVTETLSKIGAAADIWQIVHDNLWGENADLELRLAQFNRNLRVHYELALPAPDGSRHKFTVDAGERPIPCFFKSTGNYYGESVKLSLPQNHPLYVELRERNDLNVEMFARWDVVEKQVVEFLRKAKSLNEAIKLWPDVVRYLPKEAVERVNRKSEKATKVESEAARMLHQMDMDAINTSTVLARMSGGS